MLTYSPPPGQPQQDPMADARSYTEKRYRFCDDRMKKKKSLKHKILNHLNNDIFEFRKKTRFYRAQRCQNPKTMSFLTYSPPPPRPTATRPNG